MSIMVPEKTDLAPQNTEPDEDLSKAAHFVSGTMNAQLWNQWGLSDPGGVEGVRMLIGMARKAGLELTALCGYIWIPTAAPNNHETCDACMQIAQRWLGEDE